MRRNYSNYISNSKLYKYYSRSRGFVNYNYSGGLKKETEYTEYNAIKLYYDNNHSEEEVIKYKDLVSQMDINGNSIEIDLSPNELYLVAIVPKYKINYIRQLYMKLLSYIKNNELTFDVIWKCINDLVSRLFNNNCIDISLYYSNVDGVYAHIIIDPFNQLDNLKEYFLY